MADVAKLRVGSDGQPPPGKMMKELYTESPTQKFPLGMRVGMSNGTVWRYCHAAEALTRNAVLSSAKESAHHAKDLVLGSGNTAAYGGAVGDYSVKIKTSGVAITANYFQGGQYVITSHSLSLNSTQNLWIKGHAAAASDTVLTLDLENPLEFTVDSQSKGMLIQNPFANVIEYDTIGESYPVGLAPMTITTEYYFWAQTWGPTAGISSAAPPGKGAAITAGSTTGGVITSGVNITHYPIIGFGGNTAGTDSQMLPFFLTIMP